MAARLTSVQEWCESHVGDREWLVRFAHMAETAERFGDMMHAMNCVMRSPEHPALSVEQRSLLMVAYKNTLDPLRDSHRTASQLVTAAAGDAGRVKEIEAHRDDVEAQIRAVCTALLDICATHLAAGSEGPQGQVFFHKMAGDYERYLAEMEGDGSEHIGAARTQYKLASEVAKKLSPTDPVRLGLKLNLSVFFYEIMQIPDKATKVAKDAFDAAIASLEAVEAQHYKDTTLLLQLLRDNLALWTDKVDDSEASGLHPPPS